MATQKATHTHIHTCNHKRTYTHILATLTQTCARVYTHTHTRIRLCAHEHTNANIHANRNIYTYTLACLVLVVCQIADSVGSVVCCNLSNSSQANTALLAIDNIDWARRCRQLIRQWTQAQTTLSDVYKMSYLAAQSGWLSCQWQKGETIRFRLAGANCSLEGDN